MRMTLRRRKASVLTQVSNLERGRGVLRPLRDLSKIDRHTELGLKFRRLRIAASLLAVL